MDAVVFDGGYPIIEGRLDHLIIEGRPLVGQRRVERLTVAHEIHVGEFEVVQSRFMRHRRRRLEAPNGASTLFQHEVAFVVLRSERPQLFEVVFLADVFDEARTRSRVRLDVTNMGKRPWKSERLFPAIVAKSMRKLTRNGGKSIASKILNQISVGSAWKSEAKDFRCEFVDYSPMLNEKSFEVEKV